MKNSTLISILVTILVLNNNPILVSATQEKKGWRYKKLQEILRSNRDLALSWSENDWKYSSKNDSNPSTGRSLSDNVRVLHNSSDRSSHARLNPSPSASWPQSSNNDGWSVIFAPPSNSVPARNTRQRSLEPNNRVKFDFKDTRPPPVESRSDEGETTFQNAEKKFSPKSHTITEKHSSNGRKYKVIETMGGFGRRLKTTEKPSGDKAKEKILKKKNNNTSKKNLSPKLVHPSMRRQKYEKGADASNKRKQIPLAPVLPSKVIEDSQIRGPSIVVKSTMKSPENVLRKPITSVDNRPFHHHSRHRYKMYRAPSTMQTVAAPIYSSPQYSTLITGPPPTWWTKEQQKWRNNPNLIREKPRYVEKYRTNHHPPQYLRSEPSNSVRYDGPYGPPPPPGVRGVSNHDNGHHHYNTRTPPPGPPPPLPTPKLIPGQYLLPLDRKIVYISMLLAWFFWILAFWSHWKDPVKGKPPFNTPLILNVPDDGSPPILSSYR